MNILRIFLYLFWLSIHYILAKTDNIFTLKWMRKCSQQVGNTTQSPHVSLEVIFFILNDLRCQIERRPNPAVETKVSFKYFRDSKITNLNKLINYNDPIIFFYKDIKSLNVTMNNIFIVQIL